MTDLQRQAEIAGSVLWRCHVDDKVINADQLRPIMQLILKIERGELVEVEK